MTKNELAAKVAEKTGISREAVNAVISDTAETIMDALENGDSVFMRGFGCFYPKTQASKMVRNITKGESYRIPARRKPAFKAYRESIAQLNK